MYKEYQSFGEEEKLDKVEDKPDQVIPEPDKQFCCMICLEPCFPDPQITDCCDGLICLKCHNKLINKDDCP